MKNKGLIIFLIVLCSILVVGLCSLLFIGLKNGFNFKFGSSVSTQIVVDNEYDSVFDTINIYSDAADIKLLNSDTNKTRVVIYGEKDKNTVEVSDNTLNIVSKNSKCKFLCFNMKMSKVEIYVPNSIDSAFKYINIENKYGDVTIEKFGGYVIDIKSNYGDTTIDTCSKLKLVSNYGDIKIEEVYGSFDIEENFGDVRIEKAILSSNSEIENDFGDVSINDTNEIYIDAKTSFGDVDINNNYKDSDVTLKIRNSFGDIKISN